MKIKKTLKKALALLLCLAAVCSFAACAPADKDETTAATSGSGENNTTAGGETEKVEITYAFWGSEEEAANTQEVLDIYNTSQDRTHVTAAAIPGMTPIIFCSLLMSLITNMQLATPSMALTQGGPNKQTMFITYLMYRYAFKSSRTGYARAVSFVFFM